MRHTNGIAIPIDAEERGPLTTYGASQSGVISMGVTAMVNYLTLSVSPATAEAGDVNLTLSGRLSNSSGGIAGASLDTYLYYSQYSTWVKFGHIETDAEGYFSSPWEFMNLEAGNRQFKAIYPVDGTESNIATVVVAGQVATVLTCAITDPSIYVGETFTLSGYLKDASGNPVSGKTIYIYANSPNIYQEFQSIGHVTTNASGFYSYISTWAMETVDIGSWQLKAVFDGD